MKTGLILIQLFLLPAVLSAKGVLTTLPAAADTTKSKAEIREAQAKQDFEITSLILNSRRFVLEADYLSNQYGSRVFVNPMLNFIMIDSTTVTMQFGSDTRIGPNGVGGVTAEGQVLNWKLDKDEKSKSFSIRLSAMTPIGTYDILLFVSYDGHARAEITGTTAGQLKYDGRIVYLFNSRAFKGTHL